VFAVFFFLLAREERRVNMKNLMHITGKSWVQCIFCCIRLYNNFAIQLVAFLHHDYYTDEYWQEKVIQKPEYISKVHRALEKGRGLILISAHLGCWELGKHVLPDRNVKVNMVMVPTEDSAMEDLWIKFREREGLKIINLKESFFSGVEILDALRRNEIVVLHGDRIFSESAMQADFFGKKAYFPRGPVELARLSGAEVMSAFIFVEKNKTFRVIVDDGLDFIWTGDKKKDVQMNIQKMASMLEKYVALYPDQWHAFYDFWRIPDSEIDKIEYKNK